MSPRRLTPIDDDVPVGRILSRREVLAMLGGSVLVACTPAVVSTPSPNPAVPSLHFKIRSGSQEFSSQLFFDDAFTDGVFAQAPYSQRPNRTTRNANDGIYGQNGRQLTLQCTPGGSGSYTAAFDIGLTF